MKFKPSRTIRLVGSGWDKPMQRCAGGGFGLKDCDAYAEPGKKVCKKCSAPRLLEPVVSMEDLRYVMESR